ncbi:MAG: hypothetical protein NTY20_03860 [Candidatus Aenigmarchaeota archaeon]|nr:hypothetical protein [Candidatus Aenigmarchaeota archaeon]
MAIYEKFGKCRNTALLAGGIYLGIGIFSCATDALNNREKFHKYFEWEGKKYKITVVEKIEEKIGLFPVYELKVSEENPELKRQEKRIMKFIQERPERLKVGDVNEDGIPDIFYFVNTKDRNTSFSPTYELHTLEGRKNKNGELRFKEPRTLKKYRGVPDDYLFSKQSP